MLLFDICHFGKEDIDETSPNVALFLTTLT